MTRLFKILGLTATAMLLGLGFAAPASAQATRTWISGVGDDVNPCSRTAPCKTWAGAISKTAAGGEIDCLDPGGFGSVTITKSITLDCGEGGQAGGILNSGVPGVIINDPNGATTPTIKVVLRNINIDGAGTTIGTYAVRFLSGKSLMLQNVNINNQGTGGVPAVSFEPSAASVGAKLVMSNVNISNTASQDPTLGNAVQLQSAGGVAITGVLDHVTITDSAFALDAEDGATVTVTNSVLSNSFRGVHANSTSVTGAVVNLDGVTIANNSNFGIASVGTAKVRMSNTAMYNNAGGLKIAPTATVLSFGNNRIGTNGGNGGANPAPTPISVQ
ncbi:MAG: putative outer membrane protein [Sphingomonas bacterium]|nr:putative outer membrane protein [Sphingomonas bacterium]